LAEFCIVNQYDMETIAKRKLGLRAACAALDMVCDGLMTAGPERFKMI
jgi:hypothetical protein